MRFTLLHPSRGRAEKAKATFETWIKLSSGKNEIEHIISIDEDDPQKQQYISLFKESDVIICGDNDSVVQATNRAAEFATGDILIYLSDDFLCPNSWDLQILSELRRLNLVDIGGALIGDTRWLLKVDDCLQPFRAAVLTIPIMSKALCARLGFFWHPDFKSMFCDEHLFWVAKNNGWLYETPELKFPHHHCCNGKAERDETYIRSEKNWDSGKATFEKHKAAGFPI